MNFIKATILNVCGFANMGRIVLAWNNEEKERPMIDLPYWLIGWFAAQSHTDNASPHFIGCQAACIREIRQRRREAELASHRASELRKIA